METSFYDGEALGRVQDYPNSVFIWLEGSYDVRCRLQ